MKILRFLPLIFLFACAQNNYTVINYPNGYKVKADLALTPEQTERGLMYRDNLDKDKGMLFVFDEYQEKSFWMKNTFISLDIIFLNPDGKVNCVYPSVKASTAFTDDEDIAVVSCPAMYVLETAAGVSKEQGLKAGDSLIFDYVKKN